MIRSLGAAFGKIAPEALSDEALATKRKVKKANSSDQDAGVGVIGRKKVTTKRVQKNANDEKKKAKASKSKESDNEEKQTKIKSMN